MKDGVYEMSLTAYHYAHDGRLVLEKDRAQGRDDRLHVDIELRGSGNGMHGLVRVRRSASDVDRVELPDHFAIDMIGSGGTDAFNLIGTGPRGIIIEINAVRIADETDASGEGSHR